MARKLDPQEDRLFTLALFASEVPLTLEDERLFQDIAAKRDNELWLSPELREFFEREFPLHPFFR